MMSFPFVLTLLLCSLTVFALPTNRLNDKVKHYEPLKFEPHHLLRGNGKVLHTTPFSLSFSAFNKNFTLTLAKATHLIKEGAPIEYEVNGKVYTHKLDRHAYYQGELEKHSGSFAHVRIGLDGKASGVFYTRTEIYYIDPNDYHNMENKNHNHVIYRETDHDNYNETSRRLIDFIHRPPAATHDAEGFPHEEDEFNEQFVAKKRSRRAAYVNGNTMCTVALVGDSQFFINEAASSVGVAVDRMVQAFSLMENAVTAASFSPVVVLTIGRIQVYTTSGSDPYFGATTHEAFLARFSTSPSSSFSDYCIAHLFTYYDFSGVLGLAYKAIPNSVGGICSTPYHTGFSSGNNFGSASSFAQRALVTVHELGHNLGASHDAEGSSPRFVMYKFAVDGTETSHYSFSSLSITSINAAVSANGGCFDVYDDQICGNTVQETTEACDCGGLAGSCHDIDPCCSTALDCTLDGAASCSPFHLQNGKCCTSGCAFQTLGFECVPETECQNARTCDGSGVCGAVTNKADNTQCAGSEKLCVSGECSRSICFAYDTTPCDIVGANGCQITCLNSTGSCVTTDKLTINGAITVTPPYNTASVQYRSAGAACNFDGLSSISGFCSADAVPVCLDADIEESSLDKVRNFLSNISASDVLDWFTSTTGGIPNWAWLLLGLALFLAIGSSICVKRANNDERRRPPTLAMGAPMTQAAAKQMNENKAKAAQQQGMRQGQRGSPGKTAVHPV